jgi:hypothetical protein
VSDETAAAEQRRRQRQRSRGARLHRARWIGHEPRRRMTRPTWMRPQRNRRLTHCHGPCSARRRPQPRESTLVERSQQCAASRANETKNGVRSDPSEGQHGVRSDPMQRVRELCAVAPKPSRDGQRGRPGQRRRSRLDSTTRGLERFAFAAVRRTRRAVHVDSGGRAAGQRLLAGGRCAAAASDLIANSHG